MRRLRKLLGEILEGRAPIGELREIEGGARSLVPQLSSLLHMLRRREAEIAQLEAEMRQRVANRTGALERVIASLRQQATHDALTGLHNRRLLDEYLPQIVERCRAENRSLSVLMIDVDNFKPLNDMLGHAAGDQLLETLGQLIRSSIRGDDTAFRCGGDEFVIILPDADRLDAQNVADRLSSLTDELAKTLHTAWPPRLSIGICALDEVEDPTPDGLLVRADEALYRMKAEHKKSGRPLADFRGVATMPRSKNQRS